MSNPAASLVVPSRGGRHRLPVLIAALSAQSRGDWEAVVVLDGDVDDSASYLRSVEDERVRMIEFPENRGRSAALNAGHAAARGDVLIRCDDDLEPRPDFVERHVGSHQNAPQGTVGLYLNVYDENPYARVYGRPQDERFRVEAYGAPADRRWRYWAGNVSVTREDWERVGEYDTGFRAYGWEDVDWGYRLWESGVPVVLDPALETPHHVAAVTAHGRTLRAYAAGSARARFEAKHGDVLPLPATSGVWNRASAAAATALGRRGLDAVSAGIDRVLPVVPSTVGHKAVAFCVETAARSGQRRRVDDDAAVRAI